MAMSTRFKVGDKVRESLGHNVVTVTALFPLEKWTVQAKYADGTLGRWYESELTLLEEVEGVKDEFKVGDKGVVSALAGIPYLTGKLVAVTYIAQHNYVVRETNNACWAVPKASLERPKEPAVGDFDEVRDVLAKVTLSEDDPIESVLIDMVKVNRAKRADYASDGDIFSNFREVAAQQGFDSPVDSVDTLIATKQARLKALKANGRDPQNEAVEDTYLDRALYATIALALLRHEQNAEKREEASDS